MSLSAYLQPDLPGEAYTFEVAHGCNKSDLVFRSAKMIYEGDGTELHRGRLFRPSEEPDLGEDVVCKIAYHPTALSCIGHELAMYYALQHLQGVCIPVVHGYYLRQADLASRSCLVLSYCGEPVKEPFAGLDIEFKRALVQAAVHIHDAGITHSNLVEENVLDYHGLPMIIDLEEARRHLCGRDRNIVEGDISPRSSDFKCDELFQLCEDLKYWKPRTIKSVHGHAPISRGMTVEDLADTYPPHIPRDVALKKAKAAIKDHVKRYYPNKYKEWKRQRRALSHRQQSKNTTASSSNQVADFDVSGATTAAPLGA
ncbi:hypothetical protein DENSPDRAFT_265595 [Dentipellis sp. KUC8613]|nr:hypothetical protein DENSPDRAFT_265595 [Dentipellis sp. KUC8613]